MMAASISLLRYLLPGGIAGIAQPHSLTRLADYLVFLLELVRMSGQDWAHDSSSGDASEWEVRHDETSGAAYFFNTRTGESSWDAPTESYMASVGLEDAVASQWTEVFDESRGCVYYVNLHTTETRWDPPPGYAAPSVDENSTGASDSSDDGTQRLTTAEQMEKLNRLLSGDDNEENGEMGGDLHEGQPSGVVTPAQAPSSSDGPAQEMPWMMFLNESDGIPYYYNHITGECVWEPPADFVAYHQQQQDHQDREQQQLEEQQVAVETEAEAAQQEIACSGMQSAATAAVTVRETSIITPEFEEKVRRAIESVSKTPVGSSRVLFMRTPSEKCLAAKNNGDGDENNGLQRPGRAKSAGGGVSSARDGNDEMPQPTSSRTVMAPGRPRFSRPGSALSASSHPRTPQPAVISEHGVDSTLESDVDTSEANQAKGSKSESTCLDETELSNVVKSYDPETGTFIHVVEPLSPPEQAEQQQEQQPDNVHESSVDVDDSENDKLFAMALQLHFEEAALTIECLVRCFLARHRVQNMRRSAKEQEARQQREIAPSTHSVASDDIKEQHFEIVSGDTSPHEDVRRENNDDRTDQQAPPSPTAALSDATMETQPGAAAPFESVDTLEPAEGVFATTEGDDAALPDVERAATANLSERVDESSLEQKDPRPRSPPIQSDLQQAPVNSELLDSQEHEADSTSERRVSPRPLSSSTAAPSLASDAEPVLESQEPVVVAPDSTKDLSYRADLHAAEATEDRQVTSSRPSELESMLSRPVAKPKARPTSSSSKSRGQTPSSLAPSSSSSAPGVLDIAQYFTKRQVKTSAKTDQSSAEQHTSTAASPPPFIVRKRVGIPKANVRPATLPEVPTPVAAAERKQQQVQTASAAKARTRGLEMQELSELRQLYQTSAEKHAIERQQVLAMLRARSLPSPPPAKCIGLSQTSSTNREQPASSIWKLLLSDVTASVSTSNGNHEPDSENAFQTRVSQLLLDPDTFVSAMESERLWELQQRLDRLQTSSQTLDLQLEAIDLCLLQEDHFPHQEDTLSIATAVSAVAVNKKTFQAKYASKLRRRQNEVLRAIEFWQQQVAAFPQKRSVDAENNSVAAGSSSSTTPSSLYWDRVHQHYSKLSNQEVRQRNRVLCSLRGTNGDSLLHLAAWKGRQDDVARLLALAGGGDDESERVALTNVVDNTVSRCRPLHDACRGGHVEIARMLVAAGAKLDVVDAMGDSPLHIACRLGWTQLVHFLLTAAAAIEEDTTTTTLSNNNVDKERPEVRLSCSLSAFFHLRNRKKKRAMDLAKLPSLVAYLQRTF